MRLARLASRACLTLVALLSGPAAAPVQGEGLRPAAEAAGIHFGVAAGERVVAREGGRIAAEFTSLTPENALKWGALARSSPRYQFREADALVEFASRHGLRLRGHALLWSRLNGMPRWLDDHLERAADPAAEIRRLTHAHIALVVGRYAGRIAQWDVVNEPLALDRPELDRGNPFIELGGEALLADAFRWAAAADPEAELFLNEIYVERAPRRFDAFVGLVERLLAAGVPIHGVGLQGHYAILPPDGAVLRKQIARLGALGLKVEITELDIPLRHFAGAADPAAAQAEAFAAVVEACRAVPACTGITVWGLGDGDSWLGPEARALLFDDAYRPKPAYRAVREALSAR